MTIIAEDCEALRHVCFTLLHCVPHSLLYFNNIVCHHSILLSSTQTSSNELELILHSDPEFLTNSVRSSTVLVLTSSFTMTVQGCLWWHRRTYTVSNTYTSYVANEYGESP